MKTTNFFCRLLLLTALLPAGLCADDLRTVSGKVFLNYRISKVTWNRVQILHSDGGTWITHDELPAGLLQEYRSEIERQKSLHKKRTGARIRQKISQAQQEEKLTAAIELLLEIKRQYPHHELITEVEKLLKVKQCEVEAEKLLSSENANRIPAVQLEKIRKMLPHISNPELTAKLQRTAERLKIMQEQEIQKIEQEINDAADLPDLAEAVQELKKILKKYSCHPSGSPQNQFAEKVKQLIAEKQPQIDIAEAQKKERLQEYARNNPDIKSTLRQVFQRKNKTNWTLAEEIVQHSSTIDKALQKAEQQSPSAAVETLRQALNQAPYAVNKMAASRKIQESEQRIRAAAEREAKLAHLKRIRVSTGSNGEFVIKKQINWNNDWALLLVPVSEKQRVHEIWDTYRNYHKNRSLRDQYNKEADNCKNKGIHFYEAAASYRSLATQYHNSARKFLKKSDSLRKQLRENGAVGYSVDSNVCSLSNLTGPVILIASERHLVGYEFIDYFWYFEYVPGRSGSYWNITEAY